ncbi:MAG: hypothetical protein V4469_00655 [Patescibacteria group bacterium]
MDCPGGYTEAEALAAVPVIAARTKSHIKIFGKALSPMNVE